jgi:hypothetical protein
MKQYKVIPVTTGIFSGALNSSKLENLLNSYASEDWRFVRSIHEQTKVFGIFKREAHFAIFERETPNKVENKPSKITAPKPTDASATVNTVRLPQDHYQIAINGQNLGLKSVDEITNFLLDGRLTINDLYLNEVTGNWEEIRNIKNLNL